MPKVGQKKPAEPSNLRPYLSHGLDLNWVDGGMEALGDCPFCGRENKFSVNIENGRSQCFVCGEKFHHVPFLRRLWERSLGTTPDEDFETFAKDRGLVASESLFQNGVARSILSGNWLVPGYDSDLKIQTLYQYVDNGQRRLLLPTSTLGHRLFVFGKFDPDKPILYFCEGYWDGLALWEMLARAKDGETGLTATGNSKLSLLAESNVVATPGANVFEEEWAPLFADKSVILVTQNDHARVHPKSGEPIPPASWMGMRRVAGYLLRHTKNPPASLGVVCWNPSEPEKGYIEQLPSGYDVRDLLRGTSPNTENTTLGARIAALADLLALAQPYREEWLSGQASSSNGYSNEELTPLDCSDYRKLTTSWRKALRWTEGLDVALSVMLSSIASTPCIGDQLWVKIIGPASCGKSTLCEAVNVSEHILSKSTIRGFHSGWKSEDGEDHSLIAQVLGKTLVTKDGDTLLQAPNLSQILGEGRDLYDGVTRAHFRNATGNSYSNIRMTWILCGTGSLRSIDSSELGERFVDCVIMDGIDDELEDEILWRVANRTDNMSHIQADPLAADSQHNPELATAMRLTGGYVNYLRENVTELVLDVTNPDEAKRYCTRLGKFIAFMRARPSKLQNESVEREFAARLVSQLVRLSKFMAVVLNKRVVDSEVLARVRKVAFDTSRGPSLQIVTQLNQAKSAEARAVSASLNYTPHEVGELLRFMAKIGAVELDNTALSSGAKVRKQMWRLTPVMRRLYQEVAKPAEIQL